MRRRQKRRRRRGGRELDEVVAHVVEHFEAENEMWRVALRVRERRGPVGDAGVDETHSRRVRKRARGGGAAATATAVIRAVRTDQQRALPRRKRNAYVDNGVDTRVVNVRVELAQIVEDVFRADPGAAPDLDDTQRHRSH